MAGIAVVSLAAATLAVIASVAAADPVTAEPDRGDTTGYPLPAGALFVATTGSDASPGTQTAPVKTLQRAIDMAVAGDTIVVRGGQYYGQTAGVSKEITIEAYPDEEVWFDGTESLSGGWVQSGSVWYRDGFTTHFDYSPTYTRGASDGTVPGWIYINPNYPMAAHPEQIFFDDVEVAQVASLAQVVAGTFYIDYAAQRIYVGADPTGVDIASSVKQRFFQTIAKVTLRDIGIRRYAPSVPDMGAVYVAESANGCLLENIHIEDIATTAISVSGPNTTLRNVTVLRTGFTGIHGYKAHNILLDHVTVTYANHEHFNHAPAAAGMKITSTKNVTVLSSTFSDNDAAGFWADETVYGLTIASSVLSRNLGQGVIVELSQNALVVNNRILDNYESGIWIQGSGDVNIWNNSVAGGPARAGGAPAAGPAHAAAVRRLHRRRNHA